ncbi:MAG: anthranilate phosphoribosyltransferase [Planctomycetes bacterium]|nr:anthranilate phosphoribosyltransferase [Planctomycetota bacterium]
MDEANGRALALPEALSRLRERRDLGSELARRVMVEIMTGRAAPSQIGAYLMGLAVKGETADEILGSVLAMREAATPLPVPGDDLMDTCGTGGDGKGTFNISTTVAFVLAAGGVKVAKHGNRSVSSRSGSADLLEALRVRIDVEPEEAARLLSEIGICFLFAPKYHPAMKHASSVRRELGVRTLFNIVGPLANPARAARQIVGVFSRDLLELYAEVLPRLGLVEGYVFHGLEGLDELTTAGNSLVAEIAPGGTRTYVLDPASLGFAPARIEDLAGGTAAENARMALAILAGERGARRDAVVLTAAHGLLAGGRSTTLEEGVRMAEELLDSGAARDVLDKLRKAAPWTS